MLTTDRNDEPTRRSTRPRPARRSQAGAARPHGRGVRTCRRDRRHRASRQGGHARAHRSSAPASTVAPPYRLVGPRPRKECILMTVDPVQYARRWKTLGVLSLSLVIIGLDSLAAPFAGSAGQLIAVRAAMGVGAALIMPATLSIIANLFTGEERRRAIAIWAALAAVGIGLGPLAGGLLLEWFDWWSVFMVNVPFAAAALLLGIRYVPESRDPRP